MDAAEFSSKTNAYLNDYIKMADTKAAAILTITFAIGAVISGTSGQILAAARTAASWAFGIGAIIATTVAVAVTVAVWHSVRALSPKTPEASRSLNSFPDIAKMAPQDFANEVGSLAPEAIAREYSLHNHTLAIVAEAKFEALKRAMVALQVATIAAYALGLLFVGASLAKGPDNKLEPGGGRPAASVGAP